MKVVNPGYQQQTASPMRMTTGTHYQIRHHTRFRYSAPILESFMEVRMEPRSDGKQRCHSFSLTTDPESRIMSYQDSLGMTVSHFNIPGKHAQLVVKTEAVVEKRPFAPLPSSLIILTKSVPFSEPTSLPNSSCLTRHHPMVGPQNPSHFSPFPFHTRPHPIPSSFPA